jgi:Rrf2 family protein
MLRLTKKADYGLMSVKLLGEHWLRHPAEANRALSAKDIADSYHIPPQLLAKILQTLTRTGILESHAGIYGGYSLARDPAQITAFEVIRAIDGPLFITSCITVNGNCDLVGTCTIKEPLSKVNDSIRDVLTNIRIIDMCELDHSHHKSHKQDLVTLEIK